MATVNRRSVRIYLFLFIMVLSCSCRQDKTINWEAVPKVGKTSTVLLHPELERVKLDSVYSSGSGETRTKNGHIYFLDNHYHYLYLFGGDGSYLSKHLGLGRGPNETLIKKGRGFDVIVNGNVAIPGSDGDFEIFNASKNYAVSRFRLPYYPNETDPTKFSTYTYCWGNFIFRMDDRFLYIALYNEKKEFNYYDQRTVFLDKVRHVARIDQKNGQVDELIIKGFPEIYHQEPDKLFSVNAINFDLAESGFIVNFEASPIMYKCDLKGIPRYSFGESGRDIDTNWEKVPSFSPEGIQIYGKNRQRAGRYAWIEYVEETDVLCRSYIKGAAEDTDGLQVYVGTTLVADIDVPKGMKVSGYIEPYYYSQVVEEDEQLVIYRFKLQ